MAKDQCGDDSSLLLESNSNHDSNKIAFELMMSLLLESHQAECKADCRDSHAAQAVEIIQRCTSPRVCRSSR